MEQKERMQVASRRVASSSFDASVSSIPATRQFVAQHLHADFARREIALLIASELATNAVQHAASPFVVEVTARNTGVRVAVRDQSTAQVCAQAPPGHAESGRGLSLVAALSSDWGVRWTPRGKVVWADIEN